MTSLQLLVKIFLLITYYLSYFIIFSGHTTKLTWHRAIVPEGNPSSIVAAIKFNNRVRDGIEVGPRR
jgi:hypothetical protein